MNKKRICGAAICAAVIACVTLVCAAGSLLADTPLYTVRMEQVSSQMHFLPTAVHEIIYTADNGCTVNCTVSCCDSAEPLDIRTGFPTCSTCDTCANTCPETCEGNTCDHTSCQETCESTCSGWTCDPTGCQNTCYTCEKTCWDTCDGETCWPPCP